MNSNQNFRMVKLLVLALLAAAFSTSRASAQECCPEPDSFNPPAVSSSSKLASTKNVEGKFTLPFDTHWGETVLPAGDYSLRIESVNAPAVVSVRGVGERTPRARITASRIGRDSATDQSTLMVERRRGKGIVHSLYLAELGQVFYYSAAETKNQLVAQAREPIERIPVGAPEK